MGKYTLKGSLELDLIIDRDMSLIVEKLFSLKESKYFLSIYLVGGYGRGEGTVFVKEGKEYPYNDYDIVVVGKKGGFLYRKKVQKALNRLSKELSKRCGVEVELYFYSENALLSSEYNLLIHEISYGYRMIFGKKDLLKRLLKHSSLPLYEGTRLLLNRLALFFVGEYYKKDSFTIEKYLNKLYLAIGDSFLMLQGKYKVGIEEKKEAIKNLVLKEEFVKPFLKYYLEALERKKCVYDQKIDKKMLSKRYQEALFFILKYFLYYEEKRLSASFESISDYAKKLPMHAFGVSNLFKNICHHIWVYKAKCFYPSYRYLFLHPRDKLFPLVLFIIEQGVDHPFVKKVIGKKEPIKTFLTLWEKLS